MRIIAVFHEKKVEGVLGLPAAIAANPTLSLVGMQNVLEKLLPKLMAMGPFCALFTSLMARALDTSSVIAMALNLNIRTVKGLGQAGNLDQGTVIAYPGHEDDDALTWQKEGMQALLQIYSEVLFNISRTEDCNVLIVSHRPVIAALVAAATGITDIDGINAIVNDKNLVGDGYRILDYTGGELTLIQ